jgi:hypothetical protein
MSKNLISYIEAKIRICQAQFGDDYISGLTGHEEYILGSRWNLDFSITEWRSVSGKAEEIEYQQQWADDWLEDRGYVDGILLTLHQRIRPFSRTAFERDFSEAFPGNQSPHEEVSLRSTSSNIAVPQKSRRKRSATKSDSVITALRKHGFTKEGRGKTYKEIATLIASDVPGFSGRTVEAQSKIVQRALKRIA